MNFFVRIISFDYQFVMKQEEVRWDYFYDIYFVK